VAGTPPAPTPTDTAGPAPSPTETSSPTQPATPEPTASPVPASDEGSSALPWIILGVVAAAVLGGVIYLLASRSRRERALAEARGDNADGAPPAESGPPADR
jgi:copper resistance protein C